MKILLVTPYVPHRDAGHGTATIVSQYVRHMASAGHEVGVVTFTHHEREHALVAELRRHCVFVETVPYGLSSMARLWARLKSLATATPLVIPLFSNRAMRETLRRVLAAHRFDVVQIDTTQLGQYRDLVPPGIPTVLLEIDVIMKPLRRRWEHASGLIRRAHYHREWRNMCRYETRLCGRFDLVYTVTDDDRRLLLSQDPAIRVAVFRVGADAPLFEIAPRPEGGAVLLFIGAFMHPPNVDGVLWFHRDVLPRIRAKRPDVSVRLVGGSPPPAVTALGADPRVELCGGVTGPKNGPAGQRRDVGTYLASADVCVVPLRLGGGIKMKLIEMLAAGCAVVTTSVGAEGIRIRHGEEALVADEPGAFADAVLSLLDDAALRARLGREARALARRDHDWTRNMSAVEADLQALVAGGCAAATDLRQPLLLTQPSKGAGR
jgi:glycosyltransferase involved in cell wall biosynthesis